MNSLTLTGRIFKMTRGKIMAILVIGISIMSSQYAISQKDNKKFKAHQKISLNADSITAKKSEYQFPFKNINAIPYYYNEDELNLIRRYEQKRDYVHLLPLMEEYISKFGIENFYKDTELLWRLGNLYELLSHKEKARYLYKIALRHHYGKNFRNINRVYETMTTEERDNYVPLNYYYELVEFRKAIDTLHPPKSVFLNMGELINDQKFPDYGPAMNISNDILIYTKRKKELTPSKLAYRENEELYIAKNIDGYWDEAQPFAEVINSHCNEGSACISRDGKTLYFSRCIVPDFQYDCRDCKGVCDIYVSFLQEDSTWSVPRNLGANVNTKFWESQPSLSHTEDTLYFASDRLGGFGLSDIWYTYKNSRGEWMPAKNMGPTVNTRANEVSPFMHPTNEVFYFSSNGHLLNFGVIDTTEHCYRSFDIYKSVKKNGRWQDPKNIGPLVNGKGDEYYFTIDARSKDLFYARSEEESRENLELFSFPLPMEAQPDAETKLSGSLVDSATGDPFKGIVSVIDLDNGVEVAPKYLKDDGSFEFDLKDDNDYLLIIQGDDFFRIEKKFHLDGDTSFQIKTHPVKYSKWQFQHLEFDNGSSEIKPEMEQDLDKVVNFMVDHPYFKLKISGHTDSQGDEKANILLSQKRSEAIKKYVVDKGYIDASRIEAVGYGSQKPIVEEKTEEDRKVNRRVEFQIIKPSADELKLYSEEMQKKLKEDIKESEEFEENINENPINEGE